MREIEAQLQALENQKNELIDRLDDLDDKNPTECIKIIQKITQISTQIDLLKAILK